MSTYLGLFYCTVSVMFSHRFHSLTRTYNEYWFAQTWIQHVHVRHFIITAKTKVLLFRKYLQTINYCNIDNTENSQN